MKIKSLAISILATCLFFVAGFFLVAPASAAPRIYFNPATASPSKNTDINVDILIDVGTGSAFGADAVINVPPEITVKSVSNGGFFSDFGFAQSSGKIELHGFFSALFASKTGSGKFASLILTSSKDLGSSVINFTCTAGGTDTEILSSTGQNILTCSSLNQLTLTYPTNQNNISTNGSTNACGGTCGSNYNCNSGLYCYQGFCRNPDCANSTNCVCPTATPVATRKPVSTPRPSVSPTPQVIVLAKATVYPSPAPVLPTVVPSSQEIGESGSLAIWIALGLVALIVIIILINSLRKKRPPQITPPTITETTVPPQSPPTQNLPPTGF